MAIAIILLSVVCLAYANGANDNFKGVATLFGSGTTDYRKALYWATATTLLGSLTAVFLAQQLLKSFSGKGLVADSLAADPGYGAAVALGAGLTVLLATRIGMPISTTHSLVGALVGAGWAAGSTIQFDQLGSGYFVPLLVSPLIAIVVTSAVYPLLHRFRRSAGVTEETCFCIGEEQVEIVPLMNYAAAVLRAEQLSVSVGDTVTCRNHYRGRLVGIHASTLLDRSHYVSSGVVSFARGLNDTPKIAALLLLAPSFSGFGSTAVVGAAIAIGGLVSARRVAETMGHGITRMNHGQGLTANLITGAIVIGASRFGMPVSTTHVSCGALFGIGTVTGQGNRAMAGRILGAWMTTLPLGAFLGAAAYWIVGAV